jgi:tetratricopeptide (TPR) repeat protein
MYWYPVRGISGVKNANLDAAVNLEVADERNARLGFYTTTSHAAATVLVRTGNRVLLQEDVPIDPGTPFVTTLEMPSGVDEYDLHASISVDGKELIAYSPTRQLPEPMPSAVEPPPPPEQIPAVEELYLAGLRIAQFHNPALDPEPYWEEALRRDPGFSSANMALGVLALERARYDEAEGYLRAAVDRVTAQHTTPKDAEPLYYLGVVLNMQRKFDEAVDVLSRATWNAEWKAAAHFSLAELATLRGDLETALSHVDRSIAANALNIRALTLRASLLRHVGRRDDAVHVLEHARDFTDPLDVRLLAERWLLSGESDAGADLDLTLRDHSATGLETAVEYMNAGLWADAAALLDRQAAASEDAGSVSPMVYYYRGFVAEALGASEEAVQHYHTAKALPPDYVFPFQQEAVAVLRRAIEASPDDARARYYLGNLLFDWQPEEAVRLWEESASLDHTFPIVFRNLALAWSHRGGQGSLDSAIALMETAVSLSDSYPIHFFELDRLYEAAGRSPELRLEMLELHLASIIQRDDATARVINLKIVTGKADEAIELLSGRVFDIWEGGARFNPGDAWTNAHLIRGRQHLRAGAFDDAAEDFEAALIFPANLRAQESGNMAPRLAEVTYWIGIAHEAMGDAGRAEEIWRRITTLEFQPPRGGRTMSVNQGAQLYHQARSLEKLGLEEEAAGIFRELRWAGEALQADTPEAVGYFSSFGQRQSQRVTLASAHYLTGLGHLGLGQLEVARNQFESALDASPDHLGARMALSEMGAF